MAKKLNLDQRIVLGQVELVRPITSDRVHIRTTRDFRTRQNRIWRGTSFCGQTYKNVEITYREEFNMGACGRCARRFQEILQPLVDEDLTVD
jgi:hypothetical protein